MSSLAPYPALPLASTSPPAHLLPSAPQTPGASSADDSSDSEHDDSAPFTPFTPYGATDADADAGGSPSATRTSPGGFGPGAGPGAGAGASPDAAAASGAQAPFLPLKATDRRRPPGALGHAELLLEGLAEELNTLQTRAEAVYAPRREEDGALVHATVREVVDRLARLEEAAPGLGGWVPVQVLDYLDEGRNPDDYTRQMLQLTAAENQFTNGKIHAVHSYLQTLSAGLAHAFPQMAAWVPPPGIPLADGRPSSGTGGEEGPTDVPPEEGEADTKAGVGGVGVQSGEAEHIDVGMEVDLPVPGVAEAEAL